MSKIKKESLLESLLNEITEADLRRTAARMNMATKIYKSMKNRGMSQKDFAESLGKRPSEISKWLSGKHNFTIDTISDIEKVLGIDLMNTQIENVCQFSHAECFVLVPITVEKTNTNISKDGTSDFSYSQNFLMN